MSEPFDLVNYQWGVELASHGIGLAELIEDFPKSARNKDVMRGYRDTWKKKGYAQPPELEDNVSDDILLF